MRRIIRTGQRTAAALAFLLLLTGCAATWAPMGSPVTQPALTSAAYVAPDGVRLPMRVWQPEGDAPVKAAILALHGFNDYSNAFDEPGKYFAARGIVTYAYDQRGFGGSDRPGIWATADTMIADLHAAAALVRARHPDVPFYLLGESMGGAVVLTAVTEPTPAGLPPIEADGVILAAPAVWGRDSLSLLYRATLWLGVNTVPWMKLSAPRELNIMPSDNIEMLRALSRDPLIIKRTRIDAVAGLVDVMSRAADGVSKLATPSLVLFGKNEQVIPKAPVDRALTTLPRKPLPDGGRIVVAMYEDGYHMLLRDLQAEVVLGDIVHWIERPSAPLASGSEHQPTATMAASQ